MARIGIFGGALRARASGADRWLGPLLVLAFGLLVCGLLLPAVTIRSLVFEREYSLFESVLSFLLAGDYFLFAVTFLFSVAFPAFKILVGLAVWYAPEAGDARTRVLMHGLAALSKWSMLDVFIVALVVMVLDGRLLSSADVRLGVIVFSASVVVSTWCVRRVARMVPAA